MSIPLYQIPNTSYWIDEAYNLCDQDGTLYVQYGLTVPLDEWLDSLGPVLKKRQMPAYTNVRPPPNPINWGQIRWCWLGSNGMTYGILDSYLFVRDNFGNPVPAPGSMPGTSLYCKTNVGQGMKKIVPATQSRIFASQRSAGAFPTRNVPTTAFLDLQPLPTCQ